MAQSIKPALLVISGGLLQTFALKRARELGIETHLVDGSDDCPARPLADHFYKVSTKDLEAVATLAKQLADNEQTIVAELAAVQGQPADIGGYYLPDVAKLDAIMRPSATLNKALASVKA